MLIDFVNTGLALGTIAAQAFILFTIVWFFFLQKRNIKIMELLGKNAVLYAGVAALLSTLGSLFYSNVAGFAPCALCWIQRIFMYPLVIMTGVALAKKDHQIIDYILSLSVVGFLVALYHNYMNYGGVSALCQILSTDVSCVKRYVFEFGYITIPVMSLTASALIITLSLLYKFYHRKSF